MKGRLVFIYLLTVTLFSARGVAQASPDTEKSDGSLRQQKHRQEMLARYDKNHDGQLDAEETDAMKADQVSLGDVWNPGNETPPRPAGPVPPPADTAGLQQELIKRF